MKRSIALILILAGIIASAQTRLPKDASVKETVTANWSLASGLDCVYDYSVKPSTPAPKGYKAVYISHYGRHGSRYAYTSLTYTMMLDMLEKASAEGNLTPRGETLHADLKAFWERCRYKVGDLTPLGWEQHQKIAETMVKSFPAAFGKGSRVDAASSPSNRAIISMSSFCASVARNAPKADLYAHQSLMDVQATRPNEGKNPFRYQGPDMPFPFPENNSQIFQRRFPDYKTALGRLFKDPVAALGGKDPQELFFYYYMLVVGMNSLPQEDRINMDGLLTPAEYEILWELDTYERYREYRPYRTPCSSIVDDIIAKADERLASGSTGADLRFGHDHVVMALLMIMDIDGYDTLPSCAEDLVETFQTFRSCMATNLQFVFYTSKRGAPLVKLLFNGEEARFGDLEPVSGPYYDWEQLKTWLGARTALFVTR